MAKKQNKVHTGVLSLHHDGYGFVVADQKGVPDAFIPAYTVGDALHRDHVEISLQEGRQGKFEGRIVKILERGLTQLVGRYELRGKSAVVITEDLRVRRRVVVPQGCDGGARHNEMVIVKILEYPRGDRPIEGRVMKRLGQRGTDETEVKILIAQHELPGEFSGDVVAQAEAVAKGFVDKSDKGRENITHLPFITIDGEDAKDFDDAVCASVVNSDSVRVWVAIADVSNFVEAGSKLDAEAAKRGTSAYFPGFCIPMLPEALSNDICSLVPGERRFCLTAEMVIDSTGKIIKPRFYKSVIKSWYRMTYTEANELISNCYPDTLCHPCESRDPEQGGALDSCLRRNDIRKEVLTSLRALNLAAIYFRRHRRERGSIDFDLPEPSIVLDLTGKPENIVKAERNKAHMLIEDLMIAANEAVATFLTRKGYPCIFRVHDRPNPEKLIELKALLQYLNLGVSLGRDPSPKMMAKVVGAVEGRPEERLINMMLLRSMAQAVYDTQNIGHFGLASKCYCHFTSPIRRYPDLIVHRLLADALGFPGAKKLRSPHCLKKEADHSTKMERRAMEAERKALDLYSAIFMRDKIGEVYDGLVSHTAKKGVFVELLDYFVEGLIVPEELTGDTFRFEPKRFAYIGKKTGKTIHIGDKIRVRVKDVSIEDRQIYFTVIASGAKQSSVTN